jgi:hypothetical protein
MNDAFKSCNTLHRQTAVLLFPTKLVGYLPLVQYIVRERNIDYWLTAFLNSLLSVLFVIAHEKSKTWYQPCSS